MNRKRTPDEIMALFVSSTEADRTGCWLWRGYLQHGYAKWWYGQQVVARWAYEVFVGPIKAGLTLDHLCRVKACVNPLHVEPVTLAENHRRRRGHGGWKNRTRGARTIHDGSCPNEWCSICREQRHWAARETGEMEAEKSTRGQRPDPVM